MICQLVDPLKSVSVNSMLTLYKKTWVPLQYVSAILYLLKCGAINIFMLFTTNKIIFIAFFNSWFQFYSKLEIATTSCLQNTPLEALLSVLIEVTWSSSTDGHPWTRRVPSAFPRLQGQPSMPLQRTTPSIVRFSSPAQPPSSAAFYSRTLSCQF